MSKFPIVLFDGDKGGVGKSTACGAFGDWALEQGIPIAIADGDARNADVFRIFDGIVPSVEINLRTHDGWMDLADFVHSNPDRLILVSMPAGVGAEMAHEAPRFVRQAKEFDRPGISLVWVINRTMDSINLLRESLQAFGDEKPESMFVMKNLFYGDPAKFGRWENSEIRKEFEKRGGLTVNLYELHERTMDKIFADPEKIVPYSKAKVSPRDLAASIHGLSASEATELREWISDNAATFRLLAAKIGISAAKESKERNGAK